jgi:signal transduction histidine kinase
MPLRSRTNTLARRLVDQYLLFGLACVLVCLGVSLYLSFRERLDSNLWAIALIAVVLLVIGAFSQFRTSRLSSAIEEQLRTVRLAPSAGKAPLRPLSGNSPIVDGWNYLIELLAEQTAWKRIEERLADAVGNVQQGCFQQLFQELPIAVAITDQHGVIQATNQAFNSLTAEVSRPAAESSAARHMLEEVLGFRLAHNAQQVSEKLAGYHGALTFDLHRGKKLEDGVWSITRSPMEGSAQNQPQHIWLVRDVTQQLLAEQTRNQFVTTATHELRIPLTNIIAYAEMLDVEKGVSVEKQKEFCNIINAEATRLGRFIDDLLSIDQMEVGSLSLQRHQTDLAAVIESVIEHGRPEFEKKHITFETKLPAKWPKLMLDKAKIESAIVNLVGNAAKYTPERGRVGLEVEIDDTQVQIHVEDNGFGIAPQDLDRIFEKFYRSEDDRVRDLTGNGLGLSFTKEVARLHGGRVTVQSELNKGSRFTLVLPRS